MAAKMRLGKTKTILGLCFLVLLILKYESTVMTFIGLINNSKYKEPFIYMVTPTYRRAEQMPDLIRLGQTLLQVNNLLWIVAEDASKPSPEVLEYLSRSGLSYLYLRAETPTSYKTMDYKPKGVSSRNAGLEWVKKNAKDGVVYFADDDNTYDIGLFEEIRWTKRVSMFPVGLIGDYGVSTPVVKSGKLIGFYDGWIGGRIFPVDMAGFAVNVKTILDNPKCSMPFTSFTQEEGFLRILNIKLTDLHGTESR